MQVSLITKTQGVGKYEGLSSEEIVSAIARHGVIKEDNGKLVRFLMDHSHWSPLEQVNFGFEIQTSRAMGRHILRHDLHVQEHSQRYSQSAFFESIEMRKEHPVNRQSSVEAFDPHVLFNGVPMRASEATNHLLSTIEGLYDELLSVGVAKECARMILPECTTTTMTFNGVLRNWLTFLNVRHTEEAQKEIRLIAHEIGLILEKEMPSVFSRIDWRKGYFM